MDPIDPGRNMGWLSPYSLKEAGASGVFINHSEHQVSKDIVRKTLEKAEQYNLKTMIIGFNLEMVIEFDSLDPDYIGFERIDSIGTGVSMIKTESENIKQLLLKVKNPLIIGAGISTGEDVRDALSLGAKGVVLASRFVLSENPKAKLRELAAEFVRS